VESKKHGKTRDGQQRYRCMECGKTFSEPKPLAGLSTDIGDAAKALHMLLEGMSVRATARLTGLDIKTLLRMVVKAGRQCEQFMADRLYDLPCDDIQVDEVWSFVGMKEKTAFFGGGPMDAGDCYTFTAIDRTSKLLIAYHVGKRSSDDANDFAEKLANCITDGVHPQVSTDGYRPYCTAIPAAFGRNVDHGMIIKDFNTPSKSAQRRYSPATIGGVKIITNSGNPDEDRICTSHIERHNLTVRMQNRRFTRLTNAFSKKWENHEAMFAIFAAWYNYCRPHMALKIGRDKRTPAMAAGLTGKAWTIEKLLTESAKAMMA